MLNQYKKLLTQLIAFKSVSTDKSFKPEIDKTADFLNDLLKENSFESRIIKGYSNPIVVASYIADPKYKTCLIYGHYDVQPADKSEGWHSEPFALTEDKGRLIARGVVDNKGQIAIHLTSVFKLIKESNLGYNIKFMIEGDEETGSSHLESFLKDHQNLLKADFTIVSDGEIVSQIPVIETGFRGGFDIHLTLKTSEIDLHSGLYGGAAPNCAHEAAKLLSKIFDENNRVAIPDFYNNVDQISQEISKNNQNVPFDFQEYQKMTCTKALLTEPEYDFCTQVGLRPTVQITGLESGYNGEGYRNSLPPKATVKLNFRLVKSQKIEEVIGGVKKFIKENLPDYVDYEIKVGNQFEGIKLTIDNEYVVKAIDILEKAYNQKPLFKYCGGGLPIITFFNDVLKLKQVIVPLGNEDCAMHAVHENFRLDNIEKGLKFSYDFLKK